MPVFGAIIWVPFPPGTPCPASCAPARSALLRKPSLATASLATAALPSAKLPMHEAGALLCTMLLQACPALRSGYATSYGGHVSSAVDPRACRHHRAAQLQGALFPSTSQHCLPRIPQWLLKHTTLPQTNKWLCLKRRSKESTTTPPVRVQTAHVGTEAGGWGCKANPGHTPCEPKTEPRKGSRVPGHWYGVLYRHLAWGTGYRQDHRTQNL